MGQVTVRIGGYSHPVSCADGQEAHLLSMASEVEKRVASTRAMGAQFGESRMLLLAALQLADEVHDLRLELSQTRRPAGPSPAAEPDPLLADRLARIADRIEGIAATLDHP